MADSDSYTDDAGEVRGLDDAFFAKARRGRPPLPEAQRKQRVNMSLDPDLVEALRATGRGWQTRANDMLRKAMGL